MIEIVDLAHAQELDAFVLAHPYCHFMQTSAWGRVKADWGWYGLIRRNAGGEITGTMAILRHNVHYFHTNMLYAPRGPIFTPGDNETLHELVDGAKALAKKEKTYLLRLDPRLRASNTEFAEAIRKEGFSIQAASDYSQFQPRMCYVLRLTGLNPETLRAQYRRSTRYNLGKAIREGVTVRYGTMDDLPAFCNMMDQVAEKNGFEPRHEPYFRTFLTELGDSARLYIGEQNGKIVAGSITVFLGNRSWYMYGCSDIASRKNHPNEALQYKMQCDAIERGCDWFDFRGVEGYPTEDNPKIGLHQYKEGFGAEFRDYVGQCDFAVRPLMGKCVTAFQKLYNRR